MTPGHGKKRCPDIRVQMRILAELHERGEQYPTRLAGSSNIGYRMLQTCLAGLRKHGLVSVTDTEDGHCMIRITSSRIDRLENYRANFRPLMEE
ncbi:MAG: hypothetical protein FJ149_05625 [Euryarchaeota archaeon]|nr:hypothetical protein [Chloroflexota bacterium]MBM4248902.1 hypothetical protein [Euryarchaeota archaeon]